MKLHIRNTGKIEKVDIDINGITVLTGENETGKSTVGKVLYTIYSTFHNAGEQVLKSKKRNFRNTVIRTARIKANPELDFQTLNHRINSALDHYWQESDPDFSRLKIALSAPDIFDEETINDLMDQMKKIDSLSDKAVLQNILEKNIQNEFGTLNIRSFYSDDPSETKAMIKDGNIVLRENDQGILSIEEYMDLTKQIVYIDDPFILDRLNRYYDREGDIDHRQALMKSLLKKNEMDPVGEILTQEKLKPIMDKIQKICDGRIEMSEQGMYEYRSEKLRKSIPVTDVSTGIKSFMILKQLLLTGQLEENGIVVLDEPEVHLHPQWQIYFAEIIVMLQKQLGLNFVITTHSVDFLTALEYFTKKYAIENKCSYYIMELNESGSAYAKETSGHLDEAYARLSNPFIQLTNDLEEQS